MRVLVILILFLASCSSSQLGRRSPSSVHKEVLIGPEITFTNSALEEASREAGGSTINSPANEAALKRVFKAFKKLCQECKYEKKIDKYGADYYRFTYPDGYRLNITLDPAVVEVTGDPIPLNSYDDFSKRLEKHLFKATEEAGIFPSRRTGGGHIHFDLTTMFGNDPDLFRNFIVDFFNHPELTNGIFASRSPNSPHFTDLGAKKIKELRRIIYKFDHLPEDEKDIVALAKSIQENIYNYTPSGWNPPEKYQALNFTRIVNDYLPDSMKTIEIRSIRPHANPEVFGLVAEFFARRVEYLKSQGGQVNFNQNGNGQDRFLSMLDEMGEPLEKYLPILNGESFKRHTSNFDTSDYELVMKVIRSIHFDDEADYLVKMKWVKKQLNNISRNSHDMLFVFKELSKLHASFPNNVESFLSELETQEEWRGNPELGRLIDRLRETRLRPNVSDKSFFNSCKSLILNLFQPFTRAL